jgi:NAD(P)-dependent dehydrogenase (short-subunit alcohol dehydrogenase family)
MLFANDVPIYAVVLGVRLNLDGRAVIVTGASRGIGKQVAVELGRAGAGVVVAARTVDAHRRLPGTIGETVADVEAAGGRALAVRTDLRSPDDIAHLVEVTVRHFGPVAALINNAADTSGGTPSVLDINRDDWLRQFETNLHAPLALIQAVLPSMRDSGGGVIINMTSGAGDLVLALAGPLEGAAILSGERIAYAASKAGLNRLANVIAPELRGMGVAVVNVDPGFTRTELVELMGSKGLVNPADAVPMEVPTRTVLHLLTCDDPMVYTGEILRAAAFIEEQGP